MKTRRWLPVVGLLTLLVLFFSTGPSASGDDALRRFGRGIANLTWGWTDLPLTMHSEDVMYGPAAAYSYGIVKGLAKVVSRAAVGVYEVGFFYLPFPEAYWPILKPEFPLDRYNENVLMYE